MKSLLMIVSLLSSPVFAGGLPSFPTGPSQVVSCVDENQGMVLTHQSGQVSVRMDLNSPFVQSLIDQGYVIPGYLAQQGLEDMTLILSSVGLTTSTPVLVKTFKDTLEQNQIFNHWSLALEDQKFLANGRRQHTFIEAQAIDNGTAMKISFVRELKAVNKCINKDPANIYTCDKIVPVAEAQMISSLSVIIPVTDCQIQVVQ